MNNNYIYLFYSVTFLVCWIPFFTCNIMNAIYLKVSKTLYVYLLVLRCSSEHLQLLQLKWFLFTVWSTCFGAIDGSIHRNNMAWLRELRPKSHNLHHLQYWIQKSIQEDFYRFMFIVTKKCNLLFILFSTHNIMTYAVPNSKILEKYFCYCCL